MAAFFVDTVAATPETIRCVQQPAPESWAKWLLPTIVQTVVSLASIGAGVGIAFWSFRRNRQSEHEQWLRNQKAGHEQWIRDQRKAEWRDLLKTAAEIQRVLRMETMTMGKRAREIADKLKQVAHELSITSASCIFLYDFFSDAKKRARSYSFLQEADEASESMDGLIGLYNSSGLEMTQEERSRTADQIMEKTSQITNQYLAFCEWLRREAAISLGTLVVGNGFPPEAASTLSS